MTAAERCEEVLIGSLLNLGAVVRAATACGEDAAYPNTLDGLNARTYGPPGLEEDIAFCARESVLDAVPRFAGMRGPAADITL